MTQFQSAPVDLPSAAECGPGTHIRLPARIFPSASEGGISERSNQNNPDLLKACQGFAGGLREDHDSRLVIGSHRTQRGSGERYGAIHKDRGENHNV